MNKLLVQLFIKLFFYFDFILQVNATNCDGISPLHDAIDRNDLDICKLLVESG